VGSSEGLATSTARLSLGRIVVISEHSGSYPQDRPLRLAVAAKVAFPDGSMSASGLRREAQRGRLVIERIAGKDYTSVVIPTLVSHGRLY